MEEKDIQQEFSKEDILNYINKSDNDHKDDSDSKVSTINLDKKDADILLNKHKDVYENDDVRHVIDYEPNRIFHRNTSVSYKDIKITKLEKDIFLRSILLDIPFSLKLFFGGNNLSIDLRSLTVKETNSIKDYAAANNLDSEDTKLLFLSLMITRFIEKDINVGNINNLEKSLANIKMWMDNKQNYVKTFIFDAADEFELKLHKLTDYLANENFWKPQD